MAGRYCSSNIKFNMDDENQRITWEFLKQSNHKKDGSYAKILSDAFVKATSMQNEPVVTIPSDIAKQIVDEIKVYLPQINFSTAKEQNHEEVEMINKSDENNNDTSQEIPTGMLDFFMGQGT